MKIGQTGASITITTNLSGVRQLAKDLERLLKLDGKRFTVKLVAQTPKLSVLKPIPKLSEIMRDSLAAAHDDIYTANPKGQPFPQRTKLATEVARRELRAALMGSKSSLVMTRKEATRTFAKQHHLIRGAVGEAWLKLALDQVFKN